MSKLSPKQLEQLAIQAALACEWEKAVDYNLTLLKTNPHSIPTLNRLAKAYLELDQKNQAQKIYQEVLKLDPYNPIATKQLSLIPQKQASTTKLASEDFIETPGLTKTVTLVKITNKDVIASLYARQPLTLKPNGRLIGVYTDTNIKIGSLPDDLSRKLLILLTRGYQYSACIKSAKENKIVIFLREIHRPNQYAHIPSFAPHTTYQNLKTQNS